MAFKHHVSLDPKALAKYLIFTQFIQDRSDKSIHSITFEEPKACFRAYRRNILTDEIQLVGLHKEAFVRQSRVRSRTDVGVPSSIIYAESLFMALLSISEGQKPAFTVKNYAS
jgi:hypothetical protein